MEIKYNILLTLMGLEIGGAETHVVELAKGLKEEGFNVVVASNGGVYEKELAGFGIKHYKVPLHNKKPYSVFRSYKLLQEIIDEENIDLVHAHARIPAFICGILHKQKKFPFVTTAHWTFETKWGLKYITNWGQKTLVVSEDIKKYLVDNYNVNPKNIKVTINGINTEKFSPYINCSDIKEELNLKDGDAHIVYVSRLDSDRSYVAFQLIEIAGELANNLDNISIVIVGQGDKFNQLKRKAGQANEKLGRNIITMAGGRTDVNKFIALADLFIGVSRSALEAMAAGKPVILAGNEGYIGIFDESKLDSAVKSNFTCRGEKMPDTGTLKKDILKVLKEMDKSERVELGSFGKKIIKEKYSVEKMVEDNIQVYFELLKGNA